jgi:hypothetical protein
METLPGNEQNLAQGSDMGFIQRVINLFVNPGMVFKAVREKPRWIAPALLVLLFSLGMTLYITPVIQKEQRDKMVAQMEKRNMDQDKIDEAVESLNKPWMKYMIYGSAIIGTVLIILLMAGIWLFVSKTLLAGEARYAQMLEVVSLTMLIPSVGMLIKAPIMVHKMTMNVHFSLATFMADTAKESYLYRVLMNTDFFNIWYVAVLCIGIATVSGLKLQKVWPVVVGLLVLWYLASAAFGGLMG